MIWLPMAATAVPQDIITFNFYGIISLLRTTPRLVTFLIINHTRKREEHQLSWVPIQFSPGLILIVICIEIFFIIVIVTQIQKKEKKY